MAPSDSRHMLPLMPSAIFSRSTSNLSLRSTRHQHDGMGSSYSSWRRPRTSHGAVSSNSTPDLTLTALPEPPVPAIPEQFRGMQPVAINPVKPGRRVESAPRSPAKSAKRSGWHRLGRRVKSVFSLGRQRKRSSAHSVSGQGAVVIGEPYGFVHRETYGTEPLRTAGPAIGRAGTATAGIAGGESRSGDVVNQMSDRPRNRHNGGTSARAGGVSGSSRAAGSVNFDAEETAVSDDGDSIWEDCEATRLFITHQESLRKRG